MVPGSSRQRCQHIGSGKVWICRSDGHNLDLPCLSDCVRTSRSSDAGASALSLFGSVAPNEAREDPDVDLFPDVDQRRSFTMFDLAGLQRRTVQKLGRDVDIMTREGIGQRRRAANESQAFRVYGCQPTPRSCSTP